SIARAQASITPASRPSLTFGTHSRIGTPVLYGNARAIGCRYNPPVAAMRESKHRELRGTPDRGGDDRAEALLVAGLDHYFEGRYEEAIHLWTRLLFIDRGHARARAYINRARSALAERQRRADELMHAA